MKRPAFQFYPADWRKDMALQSCSVAARGLWMDMMCIAHECEPYGHLTVNGRPMTSAQIGRHTGLSERECGRLIEELEDAGVFSRTEEGVIFSRRMVHDEDVRNRRGEGGKAGSSHGAKGAEHGAKGGRPRKEKGGSENPPPDEERGDTKPPLEPPPSSSSSSSSSKTPLTPQGVGGPTFPPGFDAFWAAYPRKVGKDAAAKAFARRRVGAELLQSMLSAVEAQRDSDQWRRDGGQFIPHPATWLNEGRWMDGGGASAAPASDLYAGAL